MPLPVTDDRSADVLEGHQSQVGRRWRVRLPTLGGALVVALVAASALLVIQDDTDGAVVDAAGSMVLDDQFSPPLVANLPSTLYEGRDAVFAGSIHVDLPDRQLRGEAELHFSWAATVEDDVITIAHSAGQVDVTFGSTSCSGPFAWGADGEPAAARGSMSLRCDDGSLFAAEALLEGPGSAIADPPMRLFVTLQDGWYVAG